MFTLKKLILESEDDFNVMPSEEWNVEELGVGDTIIPDMFKHNEDWWMDGESELEILDFKPYNDNDSLIQVLVGTSNPYEIISRWMLPYINNDLKPQYQVFPPDNLTESEDYFNVTPNEEWNQHELGVGDTIIGPMWNWKSIINWCNNKSGDDHEELNRLINLWKQVYDEGVTINSIQVFEEYPWIKFDRLITWGPSVKTINNLLNPKYEIPTNNDLVESEDEFNVTPDEEWGKMTVGDTIAPHMWNLNYIDRLNYIDSNNKIDDKTINWHIEGIDSVENVILTSGNGKTVLIWIDILNKKYLKPEHQVYNPNSINESEDEFDVTPGEDWNITYLQVGDKVTYDMLRDGSQDKKYFFRKNKDAYYELVDFKNGMYGVRLYNPKDGSSSHYRVVPEWFNNDTLDPKYKLDVPIDNQVDIFAEGEEDEFNVTPNEKQWNPRELKVGDTFVTSEIQDDPFKVVFIGKAGETRKRFDYHEYNDDINIVLFGRLSGEDFYTDEKYLAFSVGYFNENYGPLNGAYISDFITEQDEDEFTVDAPQDWNVKELGINSYLDSTNRLGGDPNIRYEIKYFRKDPEGRELAGIIKQEKNEYSGMWNNVSDGPSYWSVDFVNRLLKPGYEVVYDYVAPEQLDESDDEFNVTPSVLWNLDLDTPINITITKEFEVTDWNTDTSAISIETTLIKTSVSELQEESGENYNYDEITVKNITNWINENSEVVIALFDMDGEEKKSWHDVDRGFKPSSNNLDYDLVDMDISVEIPESTLNESDEDFNVTPNETWNTIEVGDIIEPYMWLDPKKTSRYLLVGNYGAALKLKRVLSKEDETLNPGDEDRWMYNDPNIIQVITSLFNDKLKPEYRFTGHLNESDEDFNITPSEDWNIIELGVGDTLDPTNLKMQDWSKKYIIDKIEKRHGIWDYVYLDLYKYNPKLKDWEIVKQFSNNLDSVNDTLKPGFKIQEP
jgi:hypothetical protein